MKTSLLKAQYIDHRSLSPSLSLSLLRFLPFFLSFFLLVCLSITYKPWVEQEQQWEEWSSSCFNTGRSVRAKLGWGACLCGWSCEEEEEEEEEAATTGRQGWKKGKQASRQQANKRASERGSKRWRKLTTDIVSCLPQTPIIKCQNEGVSRKAPNTV